MNLSCRVTCAQRRQTMLPGEHDFSVTAQEKERTLKQTRGEVREHLDLSRLGK